MISINVGELMAPRKTHARKDGRTGGTPSIQSIGNSRAKGGFAERSSTAENDCTRTVEICPFSQFGWW